MKTIIDRPAALVAIAILAFAAPAAHATEAIAKQVQIECQICHEDPDQGAEALTEQGVYFQLMDSMTGYEQVIGRFEKCTYCHSEKAGDQSLTAEGYRFRWMMEDMVGLRAWLDENHPQPAPEEPEDD